MGRRKLVCSFGYYAIHFFRICQRFLSCYPSVPSTALLYKKHKMYYYDHRVGKAFYFSLGCHHVTFCCSLGFKVITNYICKVLQRVSDLPGRCRQILQRLSHHLKWPTFFSANVDQYFSSIWNYDFFEQFHLTIDCDATIPLTLEVSKLAY